MPDMNNPKRYAIKDSGLCKHKKGDYVLFQDWKDMADYADSLVEFGKLPCLPKDLENLRESNASLAQENYELSEKLRKIAEYSSF